MKITIAALRKEAFEVSTSIKNIKKMYRYQLELAENDEISAKKQTADAGSLARANSENMMVYFEKSLNFVSELLGLSEEEIKKMDELDRSEFERLLQKLILILQGYGEDAIDRIFARVDSEKKDLPSESASDTTPTN
jgi:hypothetical protein